jgi:hypothetical protein
MKPEQFKWTQSTTRSPECDLVWAGEDVAQKADSTAISLPAGVEGGGGVSEAVEGFVTSLPRTSGTRDDLASLKSLLTSKISSLWLRISWGLVRLDTPDTH